MLHLQTFTSEQTAVLNYTDYLYTTDYMHIIGTMNTSGNAAEFMYTNEHQVT